MKSTNSPCVCPSCPSLLQCIPVPFLLLILSSLPFSHLSPSRAVHGPQPMCLKAVAFAGTCSSQLFEQCAPQSLCSEGFAALRLETFG